MKNKKRLFVIFLIGILALAVLGVFLGLRYGKNANDTENADKKAELYNLTLEDMYCNIKESKKIMKVKITIEIASKKTFELLTEKQFLIRDDINKIIRNKAEDEIQGKEGQIGLQKEITNSLTKLFNDNSIINIYFNDLIIQ